ncbi:leucine-rich repeat, cysteine-containing subtype protein [Tanacetum coccineum]
MKANMGEEVLDLIIPYIHNVEDRSSVSLVSRMFYEIDGITHLETLGRARGKDLRSLKISKCEGYSSDGLRNVSKYCNQLRTLCLGHSYDINVNNGIWLHELALINMVLERLHVSNTDVSYAEDITLAKTCCNSLISLKIGACYLSELGDAFRYAVRLEHFGGYICDEESDLVGFQFPANMRSLSKTDLPCPNLERKLTHRGRVTHVGLIALEKGCINLESLDVLIEDTSHEALECVGTHLKNMRYFRICMGNENNIRDLPLDNGIQAMLMACSKLERLCIIHLWHGGLTDVGLEYIGKYGVIKRKDEKEEIGSLETRSNNVSDQEIY